MTTTIATRGAHVLPDGRPYRPSKGSHPRSIEPSRVAKFATRATLFIVLLYFLFPIYWLIVSATKSTADLVSSHGLWFADKISLAENVSSLTSYGQGNFWRWIANSILYAGAAGAIGVLISVSAGYAISKFKFPGRGAAQVAILGGLLMPVALLTVPLYLVFHQLGLTNSMWSVIIPTAVSPFGVFLGRIYADTVPDELLEAARIDGAGEVRIFFTIVLRLLAPAMVTIFLFIFVAAWNNFLLPLMMLDLDEMKPVTVGLYGMMSYFDADKGAVLVGSLMGVLPLIVLFLGLQRFWQSGLAAGAVKG
ncbi:carbohydrate ABC transporter permease [Buchananella hordeovulneris]|uniref:ABC transporter permease n=1 Tax=Buchananella hordeovulneris TaxID=52770 RepID=A0A1Q5PV14_9ACTO|nr:carbohydrate ABC transporter permease [Buchananella hordeovulneris]MDO5080440.1 carbohydrate ABC transporter permease [Buchananella hordeovulneris]OKL51407.1 ABC transporter permease [Buchananella hordeovulneris]RRD44333.1 carbohydrate ABC transporter permease [Buchananella hordeovulneris]RRD52421.1 carbohydrate ABC transporter permease [Buchananella hordeovulneris]